MSLDLIYLPVDCLNNEEWHFQEYAGSGITATQQDGGEFLVCVSVSLDIWFNLQLQVERINHVYKKELAGLAVVNEDSYFKILEFVSLREKNKNSIDINISDTQRQLSNILQKAVDLGASDLHITRNDILALLEVRVNGVLIPFTQLKAMQCDELVFVLYNVEATTRDTTWNRAIPQSANILYSLKGISYRFRYAHFPIFGETADCYHAVLRIIPSGLQKGSVASLSKLGLSDVELNDLKKILSNPYGAYIIAGTTGSGKSTTLKNLMEWLQINRYEDKGCFLTVEDPVEYQIYGAKQSSVVSVDGGGFHAAIKSALRRDPDVLMVGEIRDNISANALGGAVESGHYCFTTVHAGNIVSLLQRLSALGLTSDKLSTPGFIAGLQCQKLVPVLCQHCKEPHDTVTTPFGQTFNVFRRHSEGCSSCKYTGIAGRQLVVEYMLPTYPELNAISKNEWLNAYTLWREKRDSSSGLGEGFEIREKVFYHVLTGKVCAQWFSMEFGELLPENKEVLYGKIQ